MNAKINPENVVNSEAFAVATQMYVRLRRVCGRVIDVMYLVQDQSYARYIAELALATQDVELQRQVARLSNCLDLYPEPPMLEVEEIQIEALEKMEDFETYSQEVTAEEIYQAQVSHHYIGALR
ncbi:MAG: hypothetical protein RSA22_11520 [Acinetobacter sp.]